VDYPDYAHKVAESVASGENDLGILICGSGNGVCITANKHKGIRAALAWEEEIAALARQHNNANILCVPARFVSKAKAFKIVDAWLDAAFEGGRHQNRVSKIED
jgi:ribose 5-phosphate isomerase B